MSGLRFIYRDPTARVKHAGFFFPSNSQSYALFADPDLKILPRLEDFARETFLEAYKTAVAQWVKENEGNPFFQSLAFSARNTWQPSFFHGFESFARLAALIETGAEATIVFDSAEWFLHALETFDPHADIVVSRKDVIRARFVLFASPLLRARAFYRGVRFLMSRAGWGLHRKNWSIPPATRIIFLTTRFPGAMGVQDDPFWGHFPAFARESGVENVVLAQVEGLYQAPEPDHTAIALPALLTFKDRLKIVFALLTFRVRQVAIRGVPQMAVRRDILSSMENQLVLALIAHAALGRAFNQAPGAEVFLPYEGNGWETGAMMAAHEAAPKRHGTGYQHTVLSPATLKMAPFEGRICPDRILATGNGAAEMLVRLGHDPARIIPFCALRSGQAEQAQPLRGEGDILILLQGAPTDPLFIRILSDVLPPGLSVRVRQHPAQHIPLAGRFHETSGTTLEDDLAGAFLTLHNGTGAAFASMIAGVPAVYVDTGRALSSAPFEGVWDFLRWSPLDGEGFEQVLALRSRLGEVDLKRMQDRVRLCLAPPDAAILASVLQAFKT